MITFVKWKDAKGEFRWTLWAGNDKKIGCSGEGYENKSDMEHAMGLVISGASSAVIQDNTNK